MSLNSLRTSCTSGGTWLGKFLQFFPSFNSWMETKRIGSFSKAFLNYTVENVSFVVLVCSARTMHALVSSMMLREAN